MLMFPSTALVFLGAITIFAIPAHSSVTAPLTSTNLSCTSDETQCALGCCPYRNGVCCSDGFECCQHGQTCIPYIGICIGLVNEESFALVSSKATPVKNNEMACPSSFTTCGPDKCCIFTDATCCSDGEHCCPNGYRCDLPSKRCFKNSDNIYSALDTYETSGMNAFKPFSGVRKSTYKVCSSHRRCPSYMNCCLDDKGSWSCCPKPELLQYHGSNTCCNTVHGFVCCPPWDQVCTFKGCTTR